MRLALAAALIFSASAAAEPLTVPFDFSRHAIGLDVTVKGKVLHVLLDTGVDPSAIDLAKAKELGLKIDTSGGGEASGEGSAQSAKVFPVPIENLAIQGRNFGAIDGLAMDLSGMSARYGSALDGIVGYSFLKDKIVLIDYVRKQVGILDHPSDAAKSVTNCRRHYSLPIAFFPDDNIPKIPDFRFGKTTGPISLDTGSNGGIMLYQAAFDLPGVRAALVETGETTHMGARGEAKATTYKLTAPVGFGPFTLPAGEAVVLRAAPGSDTRVANIGNKLFAAMKLKMLFDYPDRVMTFYGGCR
jgi:hypothetical protein